MGEKNSYEMNRRVEPGLANKTTERKREDSGYFIHV